jgi:hypothetical protein
MMQAKLGVTVKSPRQQLRVRSEAALLQQRDECGTVLSLKRPGFWPGADVKLASWGKALAYEAPNRPTCMRNLFRLKGKPQ